MLFSSFHLNQLHIEVYNIVTQNVQYSFHKKMFYPSHALFRHYSNNIYLCFIKPKKSSKTCYSQLPVSKQTVRVDVVRPSRPAPRPRPPATRTATVRRTVAGTAPRATVSPSACDDRSDSVNISLILKLLIRCVTKGLPYYDSVGHPK